MLTPSDAGGVPVVVPSNDWWNFARDSVGAIADYQRARLISRGAVTPAGYVATNATTGNIPIGQGGQNLQQASTPGALPQMPALLSGRARSLLLIAAAAVLGAVLFVMVKRRL